MKKLLLAASLLFAMCANPAFAASTETISIVSDPLPTCQDLNFVKQLNLKDLPDMVFATIPQPMFDTLKAAYDKVGQAWPDEVDTITMGLTRTYDDQVFLFAFNKAGCFNFITHMSRGKFRDVIGAGA